LFAERERERSSRSGAQTAAGIRIGTPYLKRVPLKRKQERSGTLAGQV
jgi:hypothetical protein